MDREDRMREGATKMARMNEVLRSHGFITEYEDLATCLRVFFFTTNPNVIGASIAIGTDHYRMEILLWGKYRNLVFECKNPVFHDLEIINCVGCMLLRVRKLAGEKKPGTTCKECRDRRRIAEQHEQEERERQHEAWRAKMEANTKAEQEAALVAAQKEEAIAVKKAAEEEAAAQRAAARFLSDEEVLRRVSEIRAQGPASLRSIAKTLQKTHDVTETRLKSLFRK